MSCQISPNSCRVESSWAKVESAPTHVDLENKIDGFEFKDKVNNTIYMYVQTVLEWNMAASQYQNFTATTQ